MSKRITLEQWIKEACEDADKGKPCSMIALVHVKSIGVGTEEVHSKSLEQKTQSFSALAKFFENKACAFSQDLTGLQTFRLQAFYGSNEPQASHTFTVFEGSMTGGEVAPWSKHEPTTQGIVAQQMKHIEVLIADYRLLMADHRGFVQAVLGMFMTERQDVSKERMEMTLLTRDVLLNMTKESHASAMEKLKYVRESEERAAIAKLIPGMVNSLTGTEIVPQSVADTSILDAIAMKATPQHLQMLVATGIISQEQMVVLAQRFQKTREEAEKRASILKTMPSEDPGQQVAAGFNGVTVTENKAS